MMRALALERNEAPLSFLRRVGALAPRAVGDLKYELPLWEVGSAEEGKPRG